VNFLVEEGVSVAFDRDYLRRQELVSEALAAIHVLHIEGAAMEGDSELLRQSYLRVQEIIGDVEANFGGGFTFTTSGRSGDARMGKRLELSVSVKVAGPGRPADRP
jgi:hypothetical protein